MVKSVLFISYDGMTDPLGRSQVIPYLTGLSKCGHRITIVSAEKKNVSSANKKEIEQILNSAGIQWHPVLFGNAIPGWSAYMNYVKLKQESKKIFDLLQIDLVHCRSYIPSILGLYLKKKYNCKMIFDMRGFWADERVEGNLWRLSNPFFNVAYKYFKRKEIQLLNESDAIVSLTNNAKEEMLSWKELKISSGKINVIPCCADLDFFSEKNIDLQMKNDVATQLAISKDDFVISYAGSLGTWYLLDEMLDFFKRLLYKIPAAKFLLITHEPKENILKAVQKHLIPFDRIIITAASRNQMPLMLSFSTVAIFFIKNSFSKKASSPTKMGEIMSLGIPVVCNAGVGDVEEIVLKTKAGFAVSNFSETEYQKCIENLDVLLKTPKSMIRDGAFEFYNLETGVNSYNKIYNNL